MRSAIFWDVMQHMLRDNLSVPSSWVNKSESWPLKMGHEKLSRNVSVW